MTPVFWLLATLRPFRLKFCLIAVFIKAASLDWRQLEYSPAPHIATANSASRESDEGSSALRIPLHRTISTRWHRNAISSLGRRHCVLSSDSISSLLNLPRVLQGPTRIRRHLSTACPPIRQTYKVSLSSLHTHRHRPYSLYICPAPMWYRGRVPDQISIWTSI